MPFQPTPQLLAVLLLEVLRSRLAISARSRELCTRAPLLSAHLRRILVWAYLCGAAREKSASSPKAPTRVNDCVIVSRLRAEAFVLLPGSRARYGLVGWSVRVSR
jgi:hypothetical protein